MFTTVMNNIMKWFNKVGCEEGVTALSLQSQLVSQMIELGGPGLFLDDSYFGLDLNKIWLLLHSIRQSSLHFMKIVWQINKDPSFLPTLMD